MTTTLFLASTPLHSFWSLGLAYGPFADSSCTLALIDQREGDRNFIAEAIANHGDGPIREVLSFPRIGKQIKTKLPNARRILGDVSSLSRRLQPDQIVVGNDRRAEFYAALSAAPNAVGAYLDDGMYSYMPMQTAKAAAPLRAISNGIRGWFYGFPTENPSFVGGSVAAKEAWVMLPDVVHGGLQNKVVRRIEPQWFQQREVKAICADAVLRADIDAEQIRHLRLLLLLPHDSYMRQHPQIALEIASLARRYRARGYAVAFKRHPRSLSTDTVLLPPDCFEIPRRLPVEIIAPLLSDALVVGALTSAMISLKHLGANIEVRSLSPQTAQSAAGAVYAAAGIDTIGARDQMPKALRAFAQ